VLGEGSEEIALEEIEAIGHLMGVGVFGGDGECIGGKISGDRTGGWKVFEEGDGDASGAGADIGDEDAFTLGCAAGLGASVLEDFFDDGLRGGAGDQDAAIDLHLEAKEVLTTDEVLDGLVLEGALDQIAELGAFNFAGEAFGVGVELEAGGADDVGQEVFGEEAGAIEAFLFEGIGHPSNERAGGPGWGGAGGHEMQGSEGGTLEA